MRTDIESCEPVRMAYHSSFNATPSQLACGCPILSLRGRARGPAGPTADPDIVDEALHLFRPNVFFKSFEVQGPADRLLVYLSMHIAACLERLLDAKGGKEEAGRMLFMLAHETVRVPGEAGFGLSGLMAPPTEKAEQDLVRQYFRQCREEVGRRLIDTIYSEGDVPDKFWMAFAHRKFLNKTLDAGPGR